jgi:hypothetical protein
MTQNPDIDTKRSVRVFVSSTFRDMQAERDELVKLVFPQLRKLCEQRGVTWSEVDLRWGITSEQKAEGQVLPICLAEIRECRPYFIGMLGERYGWIVDEVPSEVVAREPWLAELHGHSVTELEILHGVLNNPAMAGHAYFYMRDPGAVQALPRGRRADFESESPEHRQKLGQLKARIRASGFPVREGFRDPAHLAELVLADLTAVINQQFPAGSEPTWLEREAAEHEAFAQSRAKVYVQRQADFARLDRHVNDGGRPLIVLGESGAGKSALLANWALHWRSASTDDLVLMHFVGATPASTDWAQTLRRLMAELQKRFALGGDLPTQPSELVRLFPEWLHAACSRGRVVLVIDALNLFEVSAEASGLSWLPRDFPANCAVVISVLPGKTQDALAQRGWQSFTIALLDRAEREALIGQYLRQYAKQLESSHIQAITGAPQTANPLFLRALLEELRVFGSFEELQQRIDYYLQSRTPDDLYVRILKRCENDYQRERPGLVGDALGLLWAARRGLTEAELLELLGRDGQPLPRAHWSALYLAIESAFLNRSGLLNFSHDYVRQAVERRYLSRPRQEKQAHRRLADYFEMQQFGRRVTRRRLGLPYVLFWLLFLPVPAALCWGLSEFVSLLPATAPSGAAVLLVAISAPALILISLTYAVLLLLFGWATAVTLRRVLRRTGNQVGAARPATPMARRVLEELPWQLQGAGAWWRLYDLLRRPDFLHAAFQLRPGEIVRCWQDVEAATLGRGGRVLRTPELRRIYRDIFTGDVRSAYRPYLHDPSSNPAAAPSIAQVLLELGHHPEAFGLIDQIASGHRDETASTSLAEALLLQANTLHQQGYTLAASAAFRDIERLTRAAGDSASLARCLTGQAACLIAYRQYDRAAPLLQEAETLTRDGSDFHRCQTLITWAACLHGQGHLADALLQLRQIEPGLLDRGDLSTLLQCLSWQHRTLAAGDDAAARAEVAQRIRGLCDDLGIADSASYLRTGDLPAQERLAKLRQEEKEWQRRGNRRFQAYALGEIGHALTVECHFPLGGMPHLQRALDLAKKQQDQSFLTELTTTLTESVDRQAPARQEEAATKVSGKRRVRPILFILLMAVGGLGLIWLLVGLLQHTLNNVAISMAIVVGILACSCLAIAARNLHGLFLRPVFCLCQEGVYVRQWAPPSFLALCFRPYRCLTAWSLIWPELKRVSIEYSALVLETAADSFVVNPSTFHASPQRQRAALEGFAWQPGATGAAAALGAAGDLDVPVNKVRAPVSELAVMTSILSVLSCALPVVGPILVALLALQARRSIARSEGRLGGASRVAIALWICALVLVLHVVTIITLLGN